MSFYGVYDGHAGRDAAAFAASHLHGRIFESTFYPADPVSYIHKNYLEAQSYKTSYTLWQLNQYKNGLGRILGHYNLK